ncbi:MAG: hypothetical protein KatS3mg061_0515 [Dehalococcoidia bacterium]|nr:MAG: hypothetical protein KatS3mg061_0515 [Dehalococcoidia bacterium]
MPPIVVVGLAGTAGVLLARLMTLPSGLALGGAAVAALLALLARRRPAVALAVGAVAAAFLGLARAQTVAQVTADDLSHRAGEWLVVRGVVVSLPERRERFTRVLVDVMAVEDGRPAAGRLQADLEPQLVPTVGELLVLHGRVERPPVFAGFDYRAVLERQGIRATMRFPRVERVGEVLGLLPTRWLAHARLFIEERLQAMLPAVPAAIATGLLVGGSEGLPPALRTAFARTGTAHLLAASGYNMALVAGAALGVATPLLGRRRAILCALLAIALYAGVTGGTPSVLRAAVMAALSLLGIWFGRQRDAATVLVVAVAGLLFLTPTLVDDVGFQLSVTATAGLLGLAGRFGKLLARLPRFGAPGLALLREPLATTLAATLATLPITVTTFGTLSVVTLPANLLATPLVAPAMAASFFALVVGTVVPPLAPLVAFPAWLFCAGLAELVTWFGKLPWAAVQVAELPIPAGGGYVLAALALLWWQPQRLQASPPRVAWRGLAVLASAAAILSWTAVVVTSQPQLQVSFVPGGAVLRSPGGRLIVVDGGARATALLGELDRLLPIWDRRIDLYLLVEGGPNRSALPDLARRLPVEHVLASATREAVLRAARTALGRELAATLVVSPTDVDLGDGTRLWLEPRSEGLAARLAAGSVLIALTPPGTRQGASIGLLQDERDQQLVVVAGSRYPLDRHEVVRLVLAADLRVLLERP